MKMLLIASIFFSSPVLCLAQASQSQISSGIDAMSNAQDQNQAQADAAAAAAAQQQQQANAAAEARQEAINARAEAAQQAANAASTAQANQDNNFKQTERQMLIQQQQIELSKEQTDANRENDMINHNLTQQDAVTAVIQSHASATTTTANAQATATVDTAKGAENLMSDTGKAEVNKSSWW